MRRAGILAVTLAVAAAGVSGTAASAASGDRKGAPGPAHLRRGQGAGQGRRLGPELRHQHRAARGAERLRAPVRGAVDGRRQRRGHRAGRHRRTRSRSRSTRPNPTCSSRRSSRTRAATRASRRSATRPRSTSTTSPRTTSCTAARSSSSRVKASGAPDDDVAAKADAIKVATELKAFASFGGPGQTDAYARGARRARRAVRGRLPDRAAPAVPRGPLAVPVADARVTRTGERALGRVRRAPSWPRARPRTRATTSRRRSRVFGVVHYDDDAGTFRRSVSHFEDLLGTVRGQARGHRPLHPRPRHRAGRRPARDHQAADRGRHERAPRRRPGVPDLPHQGGDDAGVLPGVGGARLRVHRHRGVRSPVRPEAVGARVRRVAAAGPHRRRRRRARQPDHLADRRARRRRRRSAQLVQAPLDLLHRGAPRRSRSSPRSRSAPGSFRFPLGHRPPRRRACTCRGVATTSGRASTSPAATTPP